jgi:phosphate transport system permease protein
VRPIAEQFDMSAGEIEEVRYRVRVERSTPDRVYRAITTAAAAITLVLMGLIGTFLLLKAIPAIRDVGSHFLVETKWNPDGHQWGIAALLPLTIEIALVAMAVAVPLSVGAALYLTEYAPRALRRPLTLLVDLLAAVPSIIYGLWGRFYLQPRLIHVSRWLATHLAFIPIFKTDTLGGLANSTFIAGMVVGLMALPICCAVMREVFSQAPPGEKEGALALGGTRWGMIRTVVLPFGRGGMIGGAMLGLGRALGETIAVVLIISPTLTRSIHILNGSGNSISAWIALRATESTPLGKSALMAAGLTLFIVTLVVNAFASTIVTRSRSGASTEI